MVGYIWQVMMTSMKHPVDQYLVDFVSFLLHNLFILRWQQIEAHEPVYTGHSMWADKYESHQLTRVPPPTVAPAHMKMLPSSVASRPSFSYMLPKASPSCITSQVSLRTALLPSWMLKIALPISVLYFYFFERFFGKNWQKTYHDNPA